MSFKIDRKKYTTLFGPTTGDSIRLADTELFAQIEKDYTNYGDECIFGGGKSLRDGMGQNSTETRDNAEVVDLIITGVVVIDYTGVYKADIGIKDGKIVGIGKGGNPHGMDKVDFIVGVSSDAYSGEGLIVTAGGIDTHVHFLSPEIVETALGGGTTTIIGGGTGPTDASNAANCTPGKWNLERMLKAIEGSPINVGLQGKGSGSNPEVNLEQIRAGAMALKIHEDWGTTHSTINYALEAAELEDVQITIHTDSLNECGYVEDTLKSINGRTIHGYHIEGAGGGHAPDVMSMVSYKNILPSSTTPTNPYTINTVAEHLDMLMICHHLDPKVKEDIEFGESRIRKETIGAEDVLHDIGAISMMSSDAQAMGRIGEVATRTWQIADKMKKERGSLEGDFEFNDNNRIKRYIAKYTINPAISHGIADYVGSIEVGKFADLVIWEPAYFGVKPKSIFKNGHIVYSSMGDANASIPTPGPVMLRKIWGACGDAVNENSITFVSNYAYEHGIKERLNLKRVVLPVKGTRGLTKDDMKLNSATPKVTIDHKTYEVKIDGEIINTKPSESLPMTQLYYLY